MLPKSYFATVFALACVVAGCGNRPWPASPLYPASPDTPSSWHPPTTQQEALAVLAGHYAHYDIVAYETQLPGGVLRTFIITYGFTDLLRQGNTLVQRDRFCHAAHKINQDVITSFADVATQAIVPRSTTVDVSRVDGQWKLWRPPTPTLIGVRGDPNVPLTQDRRDRRIDDADGDGKPGVTVHVQIGGIVDAELYIARREIFQYDLTLQADGSLRGQVIDGSEQLVIGASVPFLAQRNNPKQHPDLGLSPIILRPIPDTLNTCDALMAGRDQLFPKEPEFR